jgi:E3 ubiquitin-protein ligase MARCH6
MASTDILPDDPRGSPLPDIMNDPAYATNTSSRRKSVDEQDTCRICRGEGSSEGPLFYPCKCSGSIKFVHQDCLMEWLSHSQKKHCELCKTPFRFTKLYHPEMPQTLPTPIFVRELVVHGFRAVITWLRFLLVAFVWLGWLPWSMRAVWRGLFWAADGTWSVRRDRLNQSWSKRMASAHANLTGLATNGTTPLQNPFLPTTDASIVSYLINVVGSMPLTALSQIKKLLATPINDQGSIGATGNSTAQTNYSATSTPTQRPQSWLSDVEALRNLTPYSTFNNVIIDTLEGQLITLLVVVAFILIFLIREWVVQQQPGINLAAEVEGEAAARPRVEEARFREIAQFHAQLRADRLRQEALGADDAGDTNTQDQDTRRIERPIAIPRPRLPRTPSQLLASNDNQVPIDTVAYDPEGDDQTGTSRTEINGADWNLVRGTWRESTGRTGEPTAIPENQEWPGISVFMNLWHRSGSDPDEVLRIIEREGRETELGWVVLAMKRMKDRSTNNPTMPSAEESPEATRPIDTGDDPYQVPEGMKWEPFDFSARDPSTITPPRTPRTEDRSERAFGNSSVFRFDRDGNPSSSNPIDYLGTGFHDLSSDEDDSTTAPALLTPSSHESSPSDKGKQVDMGLVEGDSTIMEDPVTRRMNAALDESETIDQAVSKFVEGTETSPTQQQPLFEFENMSNTSMQVNISQPQSEAGESPKQSILERVAQWLWGQESSQTQPITVQQEDEADDEHVVQDLAGEAPFVAIAHNQLARNDNAGFAVPALDDAQDAQEAQLNANPNEVGPDPNDPEAVEDAEDLEGIMELIGMQGPLFGLLQNGVFSALLISMTVATGIWLPYVWGKVALLLLANPVTLFVKLPLRTLSLVADTLFDLALFMTGSMIYWVNSGLHLLFGLIGRFAPPFNILAKNTAVATASRAVAETSLQRLAKMALGSAFNFSESDLAAFSILSHEALQMFKDRIFETTHICMQIVSLIIYEIPLKLLGKEGQIVSHSEHLARSFMTTMIWLGERLQEFAKEIPTLISGRKWITLSVENRRGTPPLNYDLAYWDTKDRILTVILGYLFFTTCGIIYLKIARIVSGTRNGQRVQGIVADTLQQAGGVTKVILIIGIEMIIFPLYCGLLLDAALLPLFENVSLVSRVNFTLESPCTSLFVHWFIGTCYMFHFALFVSMCRKIMRSGVLCKFPQGDPFEPTTDNRATDFIRDPDDPTFHPVRDVLERNISTQLRKIAFSALVYGALVIICLGGVVWGLAYAFAGVLPVHWSSNEPVLEFPVDLLFYNFLMPLAVRFIRPSDGLHTMYNWWFHKCARFLRISEFLFGDRMEDEEGHHVRRTWRDVLTGKRGNVEKPVIGEDRRIMMDDRETAAYFLRDGRFVRTPASDQVRIPKGGQVFLEVDENNERVDGQLDRDDGLHGKTNEMFKKVYIPPYFKFRIGFLVVLIWLFAATTGISCTIIPLVVGRRIFTYILPSHLRMNDVYAFSIGIYLLGSLTYAAIRARTSLATLKTKLRPYSSSPRRAISHLAGFSLHVLRLTYAFMAFMFLLPSLVAMITELYFVIPLHTYFSSSSSLADSPPSPPIIHFIQDWTLGVLYVRMIGRVITSFYPTSLPATALRGIIRNGWLDPDIRLATRGFVLPAVVFSIIALVAPLSLGWLLNWFFPAERLVSAGLHSAKIYRYSYPGVLSLLGIVYAMYLFRRQVQVWRMRIRDEVYLIGERLHNFGEKRVRKGKGRVGRRDAGRVGRVETH